ncbi:thioredoxin-like protein [Hypoxylon fragiforme]|uniref:thioredoxin-like protein n=1 Tax=Hypoxylon fragiforme TaxID=63214 RepID=UPI0020C6B09B|nr:thioredoxin-like protein [Hypoxylon fragiforme]KAI2612925.1 thioredoxin-like protein [Hypoxylon fragiforme]
MGGRIDLYIDLASIYSYVVFVQVLKNQDLLKQHSIEVDFHPVLLGAINAGSGNTPPWTLPAKAAYGPHDTRRSLRAAGLPHLSVPALDTLLVAARTQLPLRALHHIKAEHPGAVYLGAWRLLFQAFWDARAPPNTPDALARALLASPSSSEKEHPLFTPAQASRIVDSAASGSPRLKDALRRSTAEALERGAFGAPWLWVTNASTGASEPFFGSDRWGHVYEFLGLPYRELELLPVGKGAKL